MNQRNKSRICGILFIAFAAAALAQPPPPESPRPRIPPVHSPELTADRKITFRIYAPHAESVRVTGGDMPGLTENGKMAKGENGVWEVTVGPVDPGAYRYNFNVDGVTVLDSHNPSVSESNNNPWSLVYVPGADFMDTKDVPHGSVAAVTYYSKTLQKFRRMHVYTPPGYETSTQKYPIFYLLHGAGDSDDSWSSVGRAGFILDNLIAAGKAKPMVVVMAAGHTAQGASARGAAPAGRVLDFNDDFVREFPKDIMPLVETRYRIITDRAHRAIAGLSMGGAHTLNIAIPHLDQFAYIGVFSSGLFGTFPLARRNPNDPPNATPPPPPPPDPAFENDNKAQLDNPALKKGLKLFWFSTGSADFVLRTTKSTVGFFKNHGFSPVFQESSGGHTWINWRNYLNEFAPQLFQ
jgi:enterochelin esterase-like enzyme